MSTEMHQLRERVEALEHENARLREGDHPPSGGRPPQHQPPRPPKPPTPPTIRKRSDRMVMGLPLWEIASGPDKTHGEKHGHAKAIFAIGDFADGVVAVGGIARASSPSGVSRSVWSHWAAFR